MRKYLEVFRIHFKTQITWRFDLAMTVVSTTARLTAAFILWRAVFDGADMIGGFSFEAMLSYYIICSIISTIDFSYQISFEVSGLIRAGRFSGHMVVPMSPPLFFYSMVTSESAFHLGFSVIAAFVCFMFFRTGFILTNDLPSLALALLMIPLGLAFMAAYHFFIGALTFKFLEINFFLHLQGMMISFATGALIPLSLLPDGALFFLRLLPFTHVAFTPSMLLIGRIGAAEGLEGLCVILCWLAAMAVAARFTYSKLRIRYDGVGI